MDSVLQSDIFFFISSIGFVVLGTIATLILLALLRAVNAFSKILDKVEKDIDTIGDTTKEMLEDMRDSSVFQFLFHKKRKQKSNTH